MSNDATWLDIIILVSIAFVSVFIFDDYWMSIALSLIYIIIIDHLVGTGKIKRPPHDNTGENGG